MSLDEHKAGSGAVDPDDYNVVVDAVVALQAGGGGSQSGAVRVVEFPFTFDTPNLTTGATVYTPAVGERLMDAWIERETPWNGTTPCADISQFTGEAGGPNGYGLWAYLSNAIRLDGAADSINEGGGPANAVQPTTNPATFSLSAACIAEAMTRFVSIQPTGTDMALSIASLRSVPAKFVSVDPLLLIVTQDGTRGAADPEADQGAATLCLLIAAAA